MKMSDAELNQLKEAAEKTFQAELVCSLLENYPHKLADYEITVISSLIKRLAGDVYVYMNKVISQQEKDEQ
ncbi:hypothetical protein [Citrobacter amalonaticus]|uniref:hypothetical protein n=1 Tax=Citrobacter amalonaticus TaxID=35703 RepID=UPI00076B134E|nr:hypothetical protein [Citrobacter amalonaticus]AMG53744.1 hypothetical protein AL524_11935 [Citrobacter amalonaticus]